MISLDDIDRQILNILLQDADTPYVDIAKQVHVSPGTVHVRMKNLKSTGLIQGSSLRLDRKLLDLEIVAFVGIYLERSNLYTDVMLKLQEIPEVVQIHYVTGQYNIFIQIICKNNEALHDILHNQIQQIKGVQRTESFISLSQDLERTIKMENE